MTVPSTAFIPVRTQFNIVQTQTGTLQSGTNGSVVTVTVQNPTNPLYTFSALPPSGTIAGLVTIETTGTPLTLPLQPPSGVALPRTLSIATTLVPVLAAAPPSVLPAINALSDPVQVVNAIAQLAPSAPDLAAPLVIFQGSRQFQNLWLTRLHDILCAEGGPPVEGISLCREDKSRNGWWLNGFGYFGSQDAKDAFVGDDSQIYGTMVGFDTALGSSTRAGVGVGYARSIINGKMFDTGTHVNTYKGSAFIGHEPGPWFVYGDASFGWNDYSGTRHISFAGVDRTAEANYDGQEYTAAITTGYHFLGRGFTITPLASLQYTHLNLDGYTETGADDINLRVNSQSYNFLESGLGVKVARAFSSQGKTYIPEIHFKWLHELHNPTLENTATLSVAGSPAFTAPGFKIDDDQFNVGASFTLLSCRCGAKTWSVEAGYDYDWRSDNYFAHRGMIKVASHF